MDSSRWVTGQSRRRLWRWIQRRARPMNHLHIVVVVIERQLVLLSDLYHPRGRSRGVRSAGRLRPVDWIADEWRNIRDRCAWDERWKRFWANSRNTSDKRCDRRGGNDGDGRKWWNEIDSSDNRGWIHRPTTDLSLESVEGVKVGHCVATDNPFPFLVFSQEKKKGEINYSVLLEKFHFWESPTWLAGLFCHATWEILPARFGCPTWPVIRLLGNI